MEKQFKNLRKYLCEEFKRIPHPFDPTNSSKTHQFENIEVIVEAFLKLLKFDCPEERLQSIAPDFMGAFEEFNNAKYTETDKRSSAVEKMVMRFEPFLKKLAYYKYPEKDVWHQSFSKTGLLKNKAIIPFKSDINRREVNYWREQPVCKAVIRDTFQLRHPAAHEAWKRKSAEVDRYARSVLASYLFVVADKENLRLIRNLGKGAITPEIGRKIISSLSQGVPAKEEVMVFNVGRKPFIEYFEKKFQEIKDSAISDVKFISADYGKGKTHFLDLIRQLAFRLNFVVSKVDLHFRDVPFDKFELVYQQMVKKLETNEFRQNGLEKILQSWSSTNLDKTDDELFLILQQIPINYPDLRTALVQYVINYNNSSHFKCNALIGWFYGDKINAAFRSEYHINNPISPTNVSDILHDLISFFRYLGYGGFVVMLDESEAITSLSRISQRHLANENIRRIIDNDRSTKGFYFIFASTPTFLSGDYERGAQAYDALWRRIRAPFAGFKSASLDSVIIDLPELTEEELCELGLKIQEIFEIAEGKPIPQIEVVHMKALANYVKTRADRRVGTFVRSAVNVLQESLAKGDEFDFANDYEFIVGKIIQKEREEMATN
jgi:hypothetical protein